MTELGRQFLLELADRAYGVVFTDEDVVVLAPDLSRSHFFPIELFREEQLDLLLRLAISQFIAIEDEFGWTPPDLSAN